MSVEMRDVSLFRITNVLRYQLYTHDKPRFRFFCLCIFVIR